MTMIDIDNPPLALLIPIIIVFVAPFIYSFFVDKHEKGKPQIRD
jgi:uncharacterized membrane protein